MSFSPGRKIHNCELCPRRCGANRAEGQLGFCRAGPLAQVFSYGAHFGEEPPLSGSCGSGTIFFSHCTLRCLYCQNYPWSQEGAGEAYSIGELAVVFRQLREEGCHNWNLVSPTPWLPMILPALEQAARDGQRLPVVYNTSGFERAEVVRDLRGLVDVYLTDLRYARSETALEASAAPGYVELARQALLEMWRQTGPLCRDAQGLATGGVICRLLILPGHADEVCENLDWLAANIGPELDLSVMAQYTPAYRAVGNGPWNGRITPDEYDMVCRKVEDLGFSRGWLQDYESSNNTRLAGFNFKPRRKPQ